VSGRDREFLPAALEILETPSSPLPTALMATICGFAVIALAWSYFGRLDVHAVAPGKIETAGYAKVIEPLDSGRVAAIHVEAGQAVKAGELLLELDPAEAEADSRAAEDELNASLAEIGRRRYAIEAVRKAQAKDHANSANVAEAMSYGSIEELAGQAALADGRDSALPEEFRLREDAVLRADLTRLADALAATDRRMAEKVASRKRLGMSIAFQNTLMDTLNQRVSTRQEAIDLKVGTKINLYDAKEELQRSEASLASDQGQLIENDAALKQLESEKTKTISEFIADNENRLADASRKADDARQAFAKASARLARAKLHAPIDGVVLRTAVTTVGQVVTTGQQLIVITPTGARLQAEALVANLDIGFVRLGQEAMIKVDAFPFTRFGVLHGKVVKIASAAIAEQDAKRTLANATAMANVSQEAPTAPGQPENFVFPVTIALNESAMKVDGATIPLTSGMTVAVEIKTDSRRVIDYFFSPLAKIASEAARER
jgi:hemolysin D